MMSGEQPTVEERLQSEFRHIKTSIYGVRGTVVATTDGFLVGHDVPGLDPTDLAALLAATCSLATRGIAASGNGQFREAVSRGTQGFLAVYQAGSNAIVAIIGDAELNTALLPYRVRDAVERIASYTSEFSRWSGGPAQPSPPPVSDPSAGPTPLPIRRRYY